MSFSPNTDIFLAFFIIFEWDRILESAMLYFADKSQKTDNFAWNCGFFENCRQNTLASTETFTEN